MLRTLSYMSLFVMGSFYTSAFASKTFPLDGNVRTLQAEELEKPYSQDEHYSYSKSKSFSRWVYSPWTKPIFKNNQLILSTDRDQKKQTVLISELRLSSDLLSPQKSYQIILKNSYKCHGDESLQKPCKIRLMVRCYGKTKSSDWGVTFEKIQKFEDISPEGIASLDKSVMAGKDCSKGIHISAEAIIKPGNVQYAFKELQVGFKEL